MAKNLELMKEPLFICYATLLQVWYEDFEIQTSVRDAMDDWLDEFCDTMEIDRKAHGPFINQAAAVMERMFWHAFLKDVAIVHQQSDTHAAIEAAMATKVPENKP